MEKHPIEGIMSTTLDNIRDMIDVSTVIGDAVCPVEGTTIIPISRVSFGFASGGGEYGLSEKSKSAMQAQNLPFAGGTGAGVTVQPMGFLVVMDGKVHLEPAQYSAPIDRIIDLIPSLIADVKNLASPPKA